MINRHVYPHYTNMSVQYTVNFNGCKNDNFQFKFLDFFSYFLLAEADLASTHDLCFRAKIRKYVYPCKPVLPYKSRV